jgi:hypothetical protein
VHWQQLPLLLRWQMRSPWQTWQLQAHQQQAS